jgi:hypothetical protein
MDHARKRVAVSLIALLSIETFAWAQAARTSSTGERDQCRRRR